MNIVYTEFSFVEVWFIDQASKALEVEDNVNLTLIIIKMSYSTEPRFTNTLKNMIFCHLQENLVINMIKK